MAIDINIPSQVKNYANLAAFPATGTLKTIFIAEDTNKTYRWTGSAYVEISASQAAAWGTITGTLSSQTDLQTALNAKITGNTAITGATKTKVTYDSKGLVTAGADATTADIADSLNKRYVTDANLTVIGNTSGTNTGDQTLSGLGGVPTSRTLTINGTTQDLSADRTFTISTGITIGTTAITSGTVGRVLFEGTGNVVQESANLFWDNTNARLGIGTSSPSQKLDVVGIIKGTTSAVGTMLDISGVTNSALNVINDSSGRTFLTVKGNPSATSIGGAFITGEGFQEAWCNVIARQASAGNQYWRFGNLGSSNYFAIQKLNDSASAITLTALTAFSSTGNIGINTTTDAGFKLDVNGITRFTGNSTFTASIASVSIECTSGIFAPSGANGVKWGSNVFAISSVNGVLKLSDGTNADFNRLQLGGATSAFPSIKRASNNIEIKNADDTFGAGLSVGASLNASSILQADSTTKGFLPPRMTTTQKNAIATPATGLMVYDTTLNLISVYNGTTWITL